MVQVTISRAVLQSYQLLTMEVVMCVQYDTRDKVTFVVSSYRLVNAL